MAAAEPAKPSVSTVVRVACGPTARVSGANTTPGSRKDVFHIRFTPCGAFSAVVTRSGSRPWAIAVASYRMNQAKRSMSWDTPRPGTTWARQAGSAHRCQVSATAPSR